VVDEELDPLVEAVPEIDDGTDDEQLEVPRSSHCLVAIALTRVGAPKDTVLLAV